LRACFVPFVTSWFNLLLYRTPDGTVSNCRPQHMAMARASATSGGSGRFGEVPQGLDAALHLELAGVAVAGEGLLDAVAAYCSTRTPRRRAASRITPRAWPMRMAVRGWA
jgi:hypothetical protein